MNTETGWVKPLEKWTEKEKASGHIKEIDVANLTPYKQVILRKKGEVKVGRNDPCPCGSGKKFKKCCLATPPAEKDR